MRLGERTQSIYRFIRRYRDEQGATPTIREIQDAMDIGTSTVSYHLNRLEMAGLIRHEGSNKARNIRLMDADEQEAPEGDTLQMMYGVLARLQAEKPGDRSASDRYYAMLVSDTEKLIACYQAWIKLNGEAQDG